MGQKSLIKLNKTVEHERLTKQPESDSLGCFYIYKTLFQIGLNKAFRITCIMCVIPKETVPDDQLDLSDIPEIIDWSNAIRHGQFYRPVKQQTSVRLDADVLAWLKAQGKGYQTRMNKILREAMLKDLKNHQ